MKHLFYILMVIGFLACENKKDNPKPTPPPINETKPTISQGRQDSINLLSAHPWKINSETTAKDFSSDSLAFTAKGEYYEKRSYSSFTCNIEGNYSFWKNNVLDIRSSKFCYNKSTGHIGSYFFSWEILELNENSLKVRDPYNDEILVFSKYIDPNL